MDDTVDIILTKLNLVDPTLSQSSAYQQSAEIRQLWNSVESAIKTILSVTSNSFSTNPLDASSQIITMLSASTMLSSIIHAIISTQKRIKRNDEGIESIILKEIQVILYHIQLLKQDVHQSDNNVEPAQEAIIYHTNILVDSLVAYSLTPSDSLYQVHPYKVSPSSSFYRRYSQRTTCLSQSSSTSEMSDKTLPYSHYSNSDLADSNREKPANTVGKKFMRGINSLKQRPAFSKNLLPNRHSVEPSNPEQPPNKKRIFYNHMNEEEYQSDYGSQNWNDDASSSHSSTKNSKGGSTTLRFILNGGKQPKSQSSTNSKRTSKGIKDLFQSRDHHPEVGGKKKRESISTFFNQNKKESASKDIGTKKQGSFYSSSTISISTSSAESMTKHFQDSPSTQKTEEIPHLVSPFSKKTNIHWSLDDETEDKKTEIEDNAKIENEWKQCREIYSVKPIHKDDEEDLECPYDQTVMSLINDKSRKRRSNGSLIPPLLFPSLKRDSPVPPLPTVENFLTIMNSPTHVGPSYFANRSDSSNASSQSTLNSVLVDKVADSLASTQIMEPCLSSDSTTSNSSLETVRRPEENTSRIEDDINQNTGKKLRLSLPSSVVSKEQATDNSEHEMHRLITMDPQNSDIININNQQEKQSSKSAKLKRMDAKKKKRASTSEMRLSGNEGANRFSFFSPKSTDLVSKKPSRPQIPARRSSMPIPPLKDEDAEVPPLPVDAKKIMDAYSQKPAKPALDESSTWSSFLNITKKEDNSDNAKKAKLRRSLGATPKKIKKSESNQMLKVTENGEVVLLYEMIDGKFQVMAGTPDRLFEKLADETAQDLYYVDTYIINHSSFTTSDNFLNQLICRFHLGPSPGEYEYFKKWQRSIQTKVLNVIDRWITIQYQDFKSDLKLQKKLNMFLFNNDIVLLHHFKQQIEEIHQKLKNQVIYFSSCKNHVSSVINTTSTNTTSTSSFNFNFPFVSSNNNNNQAATSNTSSNSNIRRPSNILFNLTSLTSDNSPNTPTSSSEGAANYSSLVTFESKDIARYLTLADYYLLKTILSSGLINTNNSDSSQKNNEETESNENFIDLMTKRANMLSHWVVHEICSLTYLKPKRSLVKKFIEIAKLCLEMNNYHTCMVITMGLSSAPKLKEVWESLSSRDMSTFTSLQKLLDVSMNMRHYRQKIQLSKSPCIPFLPVVLKDQTFFKENSSFLVSHPNLINFAKFISIRQFIDKTKDMVQENYWFSNDLTHFPFFPKSVVPESPPIGYPLDNIAEWVENRLCKVQDCYLQCDLLINL